MEILSPGKLESRRSSQLPWFSVQFLRKQGLYVVFLGGEGYRNGSLGGCIDGDRRLPAVCIFGVCKGEDERVGRGEKVLRSSGEM